MKNKFSKSVPARKSLCKSKYDLQGLCKSSLCKSKAKFYKKLI